MKVDIITLFPKMFKGVLGESILKIAKKKKKISVKIHNLRDWTCDKHRKVDDKPYGGGPGMIIKVAPIYGALKSLLGIAKLNKVKKDTKIILLTPKGKTFNQKEAKKFSKLKHIILICGHYEGFDERVRAFATDEVSIGDYILTGGEVPAMVVLDSVTRLIPGVLGDGNSLKCESFENSLLEYPHYTRPREFENVKVPNILLSGNHKEIEKWRKTEAIERTKKARKDLLKK